MTMHKVHVVIQDIHKVSSNCPSFLLQIIYYCRNVSLLSIKIYILQMVVDVGDLLIYKTVLDPFATSTRLVQNPDLSQNLQDLDLDPNDIYRLEYHKSRFRSSTMLDIDIVSFFKSIRPSRLLFLSTGSLKIKLKIKLFIWWWCM